MNNEVERRLYRVMIKLNKGNVKCPHSKQCIHPEICNRCNIYYGKCSVYIENVPTLIN